MNNIRPTKLASRLMALISGMCLLVSTTIAPSWAEDAASGNPPVDSSSANNAGSGNGNVDVTNQLVDTAILINGDNASSLHELQILSGQNVFIDFGSIQGGSLNLSGDIANSGNIYAFSTNSSVQTGTIGANTIVNGGLISTANIPTSLFCGLNIDASMLVANFGLNLTAVTAIVNSGSIVSSGSLAMSAPQITNSGTISAVTDIVMQSASIVNSGTIAAQLGALTALTSSITNTGVLQAMQGSINIQNIIGNSLLVDNSLGSILAQDAVIFETLGTLVDINGDILSKAGLNITGGTVAADVIKFVSPDGIIDIVADHLNGNVSVYGGDAYISALSGDLNLVHMELSGDPIFSAAGNLNLTGLFSQGAVFNTNGGDFVALAGGNIFSNAAGTIDTSGILGYGRVDLQAGVLFRVNGSLLAGNPVNTGAQFPGGFNCADCSSRYEVLGGNALVGGNIQLGNVNFITDGQSLNARAYGGLVNSGNISLGSVDTSGQAAGRSGGGITIAGPGAISLNSLVSNGAEGSFVSSSGNGGSGGNIDVQSTLSTVNIAGIVSSSGGNGADAAILNGGRGGDGNSIYITALGSVDFLADILSQGGDGGKGKKGPGAGASGGSGGDAGSGSPITIGSALGSITGSTSALIASLGGNGGRGADGKDSAGVSGGVGGKGGGGSGAGGSGGAGGDGGSIAIGGTGLVNTITAGLVQSQGGNGGRGGDGGKGLDASVIGGVYGAGGAGGQGAIGGSAGIITIGSLGAINLAAVINASGNGGNGGSGGNAGSYVLLPGSAGAGGAGGSGGNAGVSGAVSISTLTALSIGSLQLSGGKGGNGGNGGNASYDSLNLLPAALAGGVGGNGGSGADAAALDMSFLLAGYFDNIAIVGGNGGNGGLGGIESANNRANEGSGGVAGNAHGLNIAGNTILTVNNVSVLGGRGGSGLIGAAGGNAGAVELSALLDLNSSGAILVKGGRGGDSLNTTWTDITDTVIIDGYEYYSSVHFPSGYTGGQAGSAGDISLGALRDLTVGDVASIGGRGGSGFNGADGSSGGNLSLTAGRSVTSGGTLLSQGGRGGNGSVFSDAGMIIMVTSPTSTVIDGAYTYVSLNTQQLYYSGHIGGNGGNGGNSGTISVGALGAVNLNNVTARGGRGGDGFDGGNGGDALLTHIQSGLATVNSQGTISILGGRGGDAIGDVGRVSYYAYSSNSVAYSRWFASSFSGEGLTEGFEMPIERTGGSGGTAVALEIIAPISLETNIIALQGGNGGNGPRGGVGGNAGNVSLSSYGIVQVKSSLSANGGRGGDATATMQVNTSSLSASSNYQALGISGSETFSDYYVRITSANLQAGQGGDGGSIVVTTPGIARLADLSANGGKGGEGQNGNAGGNGGNGGSITIEDPLVAILSGDISVNGGRGGSSQAVLVSDYIFVSGGSSVTLPLGASRQEQISVIGSTNHQVASMGGYGGGGGTVNITAANLEQLSQLSISANGGKGGDGLVAGNGGAGGNITADIHGVGALFGGTISALGGRGGVGSDLSTQTGFSSFALSIDSVLGLASVNASSVSENYGSKQITYGGTGGVGGNVNLSSDGILAVLAVSTDGGDGGRGFVGGAGGNGGRVNLSSSGLVLADSLSANGGDGGKGSTSRSRYERTEQTSTYLGTLFGNTGVDTYTESQSRTFTGGDGGRGGNGGFVSVEAGLGSVVLSLAADGGDGGNGYSGGRGGNGGTIEIQPGLLGLQSEYLSAIGGNGGNGKAGNSIAREKIITYYYSPLTNYTERSRTRTEEMEGGNGGRGGNGGQIIVLSLSDIQLNRINLNGGRGGDGYGDEGGNGGDAGNVFALAGRNIVLSNVSLNGGRGGNGYGDEGGNGGDAGNVFALAGRNIVLSRVSQNGGRGGNGYGDEGGNGGDAGNVLALAGRNIVLSNVSQNGGRGGNGYGDEGGNGGEAGNVFALAGRNIVLSNVSLNGGRGGNGYGDEGGSGGDAGELLAIAGRNIVLSNVSQNGGRGGNGYGDEGGNGGDAGELLAIARRNIVLSNVSLNGGRGGNGYGDEGGSGGDAGNITAFAGRNLQLRNTISVNGGRGGNGYGDEGGNGGGDAGNIALVARRNILSSGYASIEAIGGRRGNNAAEGGRGGDVVLLSLTGNVNAGRTVINTSGYGNGNSAGNILVLADSGNIRLGGLTAIGRQGADGGDIALLAENVRIGCVGCPAVSIDASAFGGGDAGRIRIMTSSDNPFTVGDNVSANGTRGNIAANGRNGGRIDFLNGGGQIVNAGYSVTANGRSGEGGRILFSTDDPGNKVLNTTINGLVEATNNAGNSGRIGFHSGPALNLNIDGTGVVRAGGWVAIGNLRLGSLDLATANAGILAPYPIQLTIVGELRCNAINCYSTPVASAVVVGLTESVDNSTDKLTPEEVELPKFANIFFPSDLVRRSIPLGHEKNRGPRLLAENPNSADAKFWVVNHDPSEPFGIQGDEKLTIAAGAGTSFALVGDHVMELKSGELTVVTGETGLDVQTSMGLVSIPPNSIAFVSQSHSGKVEVATVAGGPAQVLVAQGVQHTDAGEDGRVSVAVGQQAAIVDMQIAQAGASDIGDNLKQIAPGIGLSVSSQNGESALGMLKALDQAALTGAMLHNFNQNLGSMAGAQNSNAGPQANLPVQDQEVGSKNVPAAYLLPLNAKYFVPVALQQSNSVSSSNSAVSAFKLARRDSVSAIVRSSEEAKVNLTDAGDLAVLSGEAIVVASKPMKVTAGPVSLDLIKGALVYVSLEGKVAKVRALSERGFKTITAQVGRHFVSLPSGYELMVGNSDSEIFANMRRDLIGRRRTHHVDLAKQNLAISTSEYSLSSLLQNSDLMRHMYMSEDRLDKQICSEVLKMAACLHQVTASHGNYQQVALSSKRGM